jgi:dienelactone hydrolase
VISFYGQLGADRSGRGGPLSVADRFVRPILGHYGGVDEGIPVGQVEEPARSASEQPSLIVVGTFERPPVEPA